MKHYRIIFCCLFFAILAIPLIGMLWYREPESTENKKLAEKPTIVREHKLNYKYLPELETYFSDHFAYRQELVTADAILMSHVFAQSSEQLAVVGTDDWLYLGATLDDYQGKKRMCERGIQNAATVISLMQEYVEGLGKTFVFASPPNKNTLYPEHMPYYYIRSKQPSNLERLLPVLQDRQCNYVDITSLFESREEVLYHKGDSHWDNRGAVLVADALLRQADMPHADLTQAEPEIRHDFEGDIDKILYPLARHPETEYDYAKYIDYSYQGTDDVTATVVETTGNPDVEKSLLCFRDSFGNTLLPFLADNFKTAKFCKAVPYQIDAMYTENRDVCIIELVERNLVNLVKFAPVMPAPLRTFAEETCSYQSDVVQYKKSEANGYYKFQGMLDAAYVEDTSPVYLRFCGEQDTYVVEAFPADEITEGTPSDYGYTAYIGKQAFTPGTYQVEVISHKDGRYYATIVDTNCIFEAE